MAALWFIFRHPLAPVVGAVLWLSLPVAQAIVLSRRLRFGLQRTLESSDFEPLEIPDLLDVSNEIRSLGFEQSGDFWLNGSPLRQGYRLFHHPEQRLYAAIAIMTHGEVSLLYVLFLSKSIDGTLWLTWDYPFTYVLRPPPSLQVYRCLEADSIKTLMEQHAAFLSINEQSMARLCLTSGPDAVPCFSDLLTGTLAYNLRLGLLRHGEQRDTLRYSWRGTAFLSWCVLREMFVG